MGAIQAGMGIAQTAIAASKASKLGDDQKFSVSPELRGVYNKALQRSEQGYSPAEKAAFQQQLARNATSANRMFQNVGMSGIGRAATNIMGADATNQFAAQGANIRRQNFGDLASAANRIQGVQDAETQRHNTQLNMQRQALGGAMQSGLSNVMGGINTGINAQQMSQTLNQPTGGQSQTFGNQAVSPQVAPASPQMTGPWSPTTLEGGGIPYSYANEQNGYNGPFGIQPAYDNGTGMGIYDFNAGNNYYQFGQ